MAFATLFLLFLFPFFSAAQVLSCSSCGYHCTAPALLVDCGGCDILCNGCHCSHSTAFWVIVVGVPLLLLLCCLCLCRPVRDRIVVIAGRGRREGPVVVTNNIVSPQSPSPTILYAPPPPPTTVVLQTPLLGGHY